MLKNNFFWSLVLFALVVIFSILSKWFPIFDLGVFNYSILLILSLLVPNIAWIFKEIDNSEIEKIKLPFCELKLLKKFDYYFLGSRRNDEEISDIVVLAYYKNVLNEKEALELFHDEFPNQEDLDVIEIVKQVHYKVSD